MERKKREYPPFICVKGGGGKNNLKGGGEVSPTDVDIFSSISFYSTGDAGFRGEKERDRSLPMLA